jgi:hypothetical protein
MGFIWTQLTLNTFENMNFPNPSARLENKVRSFVQSAVPSTFFGLRVYRNCGLFGSVEIVDTVAHSSSKMANWRKNSERKMQEKMLKNRLTCILPVFSAVSSFGDAFFSFSI